MSRAATAADLPTGSCKTKTWRVASRKTRQVFDSLPIGPGTYTIWLRGYADAAGDSVYAGLNGQPLAGGAIISDFLFPPGATGLAQ